MMHVRSSARDAFVVCESDSRKSSTVDWSAAGEEGSTPNAKRRGKHTSGDTVIDEVWRLEEVEEGVLLEVLLATLRKTKAEVAGSKKVRRSEGICALLTLIPLPRVKRSPCRLILLAH